MKVPSGWTLEHTGGNCTGWRYELTKTSYAFITQAGDPCAPERATDRCLLGVYGVDERQIVALDVASPREAVRLALRIAFVEEVEV